MSVGSAPESIPAGTSSHHYATLNVWDSSTEFVTEVDVFWLGTVALAP
jgi:hypothetical protein